VLAIGESQSAVFLTIYVNGIERLAKVYDGFLIHSQFGSSSAFDGSRMAGTPNAMPADVHFRPEPADVAVLAGVESPTEQDHVLSVRKNRVI